MKSNNDESPENEIPWMTRFQNKFNEFKSQQWVSDLLTFLSELLAACIKSARWVLTLTSNSNQSSEQQASWRTRLQYKFDNFMSKGGFSVFLALLSVFFAAFAVMTIIRYIAEWLFPNESLEVASDLSWEIFVQLIGLRDTGDEANLAAKLVGVITIFIGLVLFSSLIAFITQQFEARLELLRKGKSRVVEENHTLILGFSDKILDIITELVVANESETDAAVVILSQDDKEKMDDFLRHNLGDLKTTRVVTRNGSITNLSDLKNVAVQAAKSVIILSEATPADDEEAKALADARVLKSILAVFAANEEDNLPPIVVELHSEQYRRLAENLVPGAITTLNEADILARILVQTSRSVGLATVFLNLVGFEGNEFYFYRPASGWHGVTFGELPFRFLHCMPIGVRRADGSLQLGPGKDYKLAYNDEAIVLAEDDSTIEFESEAVVQPRVFGYGDYKRTLERKPEKHLVIGWNSKAPIALKEYAKFLIEGSEVNLAVQDLTHEMQAEFDKISKAYPHIKMEAKEVNLNSIRQLKTLKPYDYNSISILAANGQNAEEMDAKTLTVLLELQEIFRDYRAETKNKVNTELIAEIVDSQETDLVIRAGVKDFLLTNQFVSKILAQVSQEPDVLSIYRELFGAEGNELYIKPISLYFPPERLGKVTFADCVLAAQNRNEVCLGVRINAQAQIKSKNFGIDLVPPLEKQLYLTVNDALIALAEDET